MPADGELGTHAETGIAIAHAQASKDDVTSKKVYTSTLYQRLAGSVFALFACLSIFLVLLENRIGAFLSQLDEGFVSGSRWARRGSSGGWRTSRWAVPTQVIARVAPEWPMRPARDSIGR